MRPEKGFRGRRGGGEGARRPDCEGDGPDRDADHRHAGDFREIRGGDRSDRASDRGNVLADRFRRGGSRRAAGGDRRDCAQRCGSGARHAGNRRTTSPRCAKPRVTPQRPPSSCSPPPTSSPKTPAIWKRKSRSSSSACASGRLHRTEPPLSHARDPGCIAGVAATRTGTRSVITCGKIRMCRYDRLSARFFRDGRAGAWIWRGGQEVGKAKPDAGWLIDQQVTFIYTRDLAAGSSFLSDKLGLERVLDQFGICHIYRVTGTSFSGCVRQS